MTRLTEAPGYDKFTMDFADKIARQFDQQKSDKDFWESINA